MEQQYETNKRKSEQLRSEVHVGNKKMRPKTRSPNRDYKNKRRHSRSRSPRVSAKMDKKKPQQDVKTEPVVRKTKETDMLNTRTGGAYIPPARLRMMQEQITDKSSAPYQRLAWEALKKSIHGHINKINVGNIGIIIRELLKENIVRGRGLLTRSIIQAQAASPTFTNVYAALVAAVNSRFPNIGELLLKRLVIQFKRGFKRNDKAVCISSVTFIAHLVNQRVAHEILALELLTLLVESPTDDSVEVAIAFLKECGLKLTEVSSKGVNAIFEMLRNILHEGQLDKRVQYMIEVMFQVWKDGFKDHPSVIEELELVPEEEQFTHLLMLDDATDAQDILNVFKLDEKYEENELKYKALCKDILGSDDESGQEDGSEESGTDGSDDEEESEKKEGVTVVDYTETNLVALRTTIYLTINSSLDFEECAHKLMKMQLKPGQEKELCHMFLDCCAEQRTYEKFYGLLAQRFCNINKIYIEPFEEIFKDSYATSHRLETNKLRNVSKFFAHLLFTDSISWEVLDCVKLNEEDTTSSSRIYIKILFQELAEYMGLEKLNNRLQDPTLQDAFSGLFPRDNPKNTRFSINFFTSIGLGGLTNELREHLNQMPKNLPPAITEIKVDSSSDSSSSSSSGSSSSSDDSSDSDDDNATEHNKNSLDKNKTDKAIQSRNITEVQEQEKDKERWGHDGFYSTYGQNATRTDSRDNRYDKDRYQQSRNQSDKSKEVDKNRDQIGVRRNRDRGSQRDQYKDRYIERDTRNIENESEYRKEKSKRAYQENTNERGSHKEHGYRSTEQEKNKHANDKRRDKSKNDDAHDREKRKYKDNIHTEKTNDADENRYPNIRSGTPELSRDMIDRMNRNKIDTRSTDHRKDKHKYDSSSNQASGDKHKRIKEQRKEKRYVRNSSDNEDARETIDKYEQREKSKSDRHKKGGKDKSEDGWDIGCRENLSRGARYWDAA